MKNKFNISRVFSAEKPNSNSAKQMMNITDNTHLHKTAVSGSAYVFDPLKHGFEPISNYPELGFNYPMIDGYFVKVVCYDNF
jgi:hypothetical protein